MKNNIYYIFDKKNDIAINSFLAIDNQIAKSQVLDSLKKTFYILKNSKNVNEQATVKNYLENAKNYELKTKNDEKLIELKEIIEKLEKNNGST